MKKLIFFVSFLVTGAGLFSAPASASIVAFSTYSQVNAYSFVNTFSSPTYIDSADIVFSFSSSADTFTITMDNYHEGVYYTVANTSAWCSPATARCDFIFRDVGIVANRLRFRSFRSSGAAAFGWWYLNQSYYKTSDDESLSAVNDSVLWFRDFFSFQDTQGFLFFGLILLGAFFSGLKFGGNT